MGVLASRGMECRLEDVLCCLSERFSKFVCGWHVRLYRYGPALFDMSYRVLDRANPEPNETTPLYDLLALGAEKLRDLIQNGGYDGVICVHVFAGMMVTEVRRKYGLRIPCFFVATDYSCAPFTEQCDLDGYFSPEERLTAEFASRGLPREKLIPSGIPVRQAFYSREPKEQARQALGLRTEGKVALLMGGSMGCGPMRKIARELADKVSGDDMLVVVCGRNERLYETLADLQSSNVQVLGFTDRIAEYMDAADLIVTKPGGLSSTEAGNKHLPMVLINAVGGCEARNFEIFLERGYAVGSKNAEDVIALVGKLLADPGRLEQMRRALERDFTGNAAERIADRVTKAVEGSRQALR